MVPKVTISVKYQSDVEKVVDVERYTSSKKQNKNPKTVGQTGQSKMPLFHDRMFLLVCLFEVFASNSRIFHSYGDVTITGGGLLILTNTRHS